MGHKKQEAIEKKARTRLNPHERAALNYATLEQAFATVADTLLDAWMDPHAPLIKMNCKRMDHGGMLIVLVRDNDTVTEDIMTGGEDILDAMLGMSKKLKRSDWKVAKEWPPKEEAS